MTHSLRKTDSRHGLGILARTALFSWLVAIVALGVFIAVVVPAQRAAYLDNLASKAHGVAASLQDIAAGAAISEDYSAIVDHCTRILAEDASIDYLVLTRKDGFSLIHDRQGWRSDQLQGLWLPHERVAGGFLRHDPETQGEFYHYSRPFDYSGIQWGWIHVGLSLRGYNESVQALYHRTSLAGVISLLLGLFISVFYARQLTRPIMRLREAVLRLAGGDLSVRASVSAKDEVGELGASFNRMTESLLQRDTMLQSIRFAAQQFLSAEDWRSVIQEVLAQLGHAADASRIYVFENLALPDCRSIMSQRFEWAADHALPEIDDPTLQDFDFEAAGVERWVSILASGRPLVGGAAEFPPKEWDLLSAHGIRSLALIPIHVGTRWWGLMGVDECRRERTWSEAEVTGFRAAAHTLGAAIERNEARQALVIAKDAAEAASEAKSQFLANMSHEIRTPITGVMGMLHLLQRTELNQKQSRYVGNAVAAAGTLLTVIGDVLDFSKIEARRLELEESTFSVPDMLEDAVRGFAQRAEAAGLELVYRLPHEVPRVVRGDPVRLRQILVNLIGNALKFTEQGEIAVACAVEEEAEETILLRFAVRDTGCGIAPDKQEMIFESFSQADSSMTRGHGGTGLGLAICRQLAQLMGGEIGVESRLGAGSTFWFTARLKQAPAQRADDVMPPDGLRDLRLLVVDDCATTLYVVSEYVRSWRGDVRTAPDADAALQLLRRAAADGEPFRVAVLDWRMPGIDGVTLARRIKADASLRETGLVLMSGYGPLGPEEEVASIFSASVPKPIRMSELYDAIITAAHGASSSRRRRRSAPRTAPLPADLPSASGVVLLVEDNEINREVAGEMLSALGYRSIHAVNGRDAVKVVQTQPVDLVLMDCQMPILDGYEATRQIRRWEAERSADAAERRVPIVALTAHAMKGDRDVCLQCGMDDFLTKPLEPEALARTLRQWMPAESATRPTSEDRPVESESADAPIAFGQLVRRCMDRTELAERLVRKFVDLLPGYREELGRAVSNGDAEAIRQSAHRLKGCAANVSANALSRLAAELEERSREARLEGMTELWQRLESEARTIERLDPQNVRKAA